MDKNKKYPKTPGRKKLSSTLLIIISLAGAAIISWQAFSAIKESKLSNVPAVPPGLESQTSPHETSLIFPVPILMYHHIQEYHSEDSSSYKDLVVSPENFEAQLDWLSTNGFQTVGLDYFKNPTRSSKKPIVLTFDDGFRDAYEQAFPILKKYGFQGTFYLVVNDIGKSGSLTKDEILEMQDAGMRFGSHTLTHQDLPTVSLQRAQQEIYDSKTILEQAIGRDVKDFCYPGGTLNRDIENIVINSGYETATTTNNEVNAGNVDPFRLNRLNIKNDTDFNKLPALRNL